MLSQQPQDQSKKTSENDKNVFDLSNLQKFKFDTSKIEPIPYVVKMQEKLDLRDLSKNKVDRSMLSSPPKSNLF